PEPRAPTSFPPLYVAKHADGVDYGESESPPEAGADKPQPGEMNEGATEQRNEKPVAARRLEAQDADARIAARREIFPHTHADQQQKDGGEEGGGRPRPGHPGEVHHTLPRAKPLAM